MILGIDHVGLLTDDPRAVGAHLAALGMRRTEEGNADGYRVACEFWRAPTGGPAVELVTPLDEQSITTGHLARKGPGLYHVAFEVDDLECERDRLRTNGFAVVDRTPCSGALPGMHVTFLYLGGPANLLVELVHYAERGGFTEGSNPVPATDGAPS